MEQAVAAADGEAVAAVDNEDIHMADPDPDDQEPGPNADQNDEENSRESSTSGNSNGVADPSSGSGEPGNSLAATSNSNEGGDVQLYVNWVAEAAAARRPSNEPLPEALIQVMSKVFDNDMLLEHILEKMIFENDRASIRSCRLVAKPWLIALAKLFRKKKKPQFFVNTSKDAALANEPRPRPMFDQHTLLYEFIKPMTTNVRHEGFIPTFCLTLGPSYFRKNNYTDFVNCLVQCGSSLVELYIHFPKNSAMSFLLPPDISLPNLATFGVSFSGQSLLGHHFPVPYHHQHDYFPNYCSIHLVQGVFNASKSLRNFYFLQSVSPLNPPDLENLYFPETLSSVRIETPMRDFELFMRRPLPCLSEIRINSTISLYPEETIYDLLSKLSGTLRIIWLTGPPATRRSLPLKLPRLDHVTKFYMFKPWEFEERDTITNFEEVFPVLQTLVFANQTQYSFNYLMKGMRSTTVTSFCVCLTSLRPTRPGLDIHDELGLGGVAGRVGLAAAAAAAAGHPQVWREVQEEERLRREMQYRLLRIRELALRGRRLRRERDGEQQQQNQNQNQNQPAQAPVQAHRRAAPVAAPGPEIDRVDRERAINQLHEVANRRDQVRDDHFRIIQVEQHLQELREQEERYERARLYRGDDVPPPLVAEVEPLNRNNENPPGNEQRRERQRPMLEIRRVVPPVPAAAVLAMPQRNQLVPAAGARAQVAMRGNRAAVQGFRVVHLPGAGARVIRIPRFAANNANQNREGDGGAGGNDPLNLMHRVRNREGEVVMRGLMIVDPAEVAAVDDEILERGLPDGAENRPAAPPPPVPANEDEVDQNEALINENELFLNLALSDDDDEEVPDNRGENNQPIPIAQEMPRRIIPGDDGGIRVIFQPQPRAPLSPPHVLILSSDDSSETDDDDDDDDDAWVPNAPADPHNEQDGGLGLFIAARREEAERRRAHAVGEDGGRPRANENDNNNNNAAAAPVAVVAPARVPNLAAAAAAAVRQQVRQEVQGEPENPRGNEDLEELEEQNDRRLVYYRARDRLMRGDRGGDRGRMPVRRLVNDLRRRGIGDNLIGLYDRRNPHGPPRLPERPITMTMDKMQSINLAFPNLVKLTIQVSGPDACGIRYIFEEMTSLQVLKIIVERSIWTIKWDSLFTGIPEDFCDAVKSNAEIWDDVYLTENPASVRNMTKLEELMMVETVKATDREQQPQNLEERYISDVAFQFGFLKLRGLKRLTVTQGFSPSQAMLNRWYDEKGYKIEIKPKTRLDLNYYASL